MADYATMVAALAKDGDEILGSMDSKEAHLVHMVMGISGEAGELLDAVKKHWAYRKELDLENVIEELGDLEFYMEGLRQGLGITREKVLEENMAKLAVRYSGMKYSDEAAVARADKQG